MTRLVNRETELDPGEDEGEPDVAFVLLLAIIVVFGLEAASGTFASRSADPLTKADKLIRIGGEYGPLIRERGEWWRLFSATFLHANFAHIACNGIALVFAGYALERAIGRAWFAAIFTLGGLAGGLFSLALNKPEVVSVGASGAIMGLFAGALALSFRYDWDTKRSKNLRSGAWMVLIPSLIPTLSGKTDIASHFGGTIAGGVIGLVLLALWRDEEPRPPFPRGAAVFAFLGLCGTLFAFGKVIFG
ncbi:MAG TPA: rhomboid family intramembrane serine protease [Hyphomicrobiales bacterium]|nr:rhomboid family intramembrane serine protease [Hyphomicrobiales bacterium]